MKKLSYLLSSVFLTLFLSAPLFSQQVYVDLRQNVGYVGVPIPLTVVYENIESDGEPSIPKIDGFSIYKRQGEQTSSQTTIINGKVTSTSTTSVTFVLTPERKGKLTIPALTFLAGGKAFQTSPRTIEVKEPPTGGAVRAEISGTHGDIYLGRPIDLTLRIFLEQFNDPNLGVELDAQDMFGRIRNDSSFGIFKEALQDGNISAQKVSGLNNSGAATSFFVYEVHATAWPETTGKMTLSPVTILVDYPISISRQRRTGFFGGNQLVVSQSQLISARAETPSIEVLSTPTDNKPTWYSGAVGNFDFRLIAQPTKIKVGEPITLTMRVTDLTSGKVNLDYLAAPLLDRVPALTDNFKVPDKPLGGTVDGRGKTFTQTIRPRNDTTTEIPPLPFTSFDPSSGEYVTSWSKAIPIQVQAVETISASDLIGANQSAQPKSTPTEVEGGILANYTGNSLLNSEEVAMTASLLFLIALPPVTFLVVVTWLALKKHATLPTALKKSATKQATKMLKNASSLSQDIQANEISKALRILKSNQSQNENTTRQMEELLKRCDASQFGGLPDSKLAKDAATLVEQLS
jgi:hypothetical protein